MNKKTGTRQVNGWMLISIVLLLLIGTIIVNIYINQKKNNLVNLGNIQMPKYYLEQMDKNIDLKNKTTFYVCDMSVNKCQLIKKNI